jgi:hypothetical protein
MRRRKYLEEKYYDKVNCLIPYLLLMLYLYRAYLYGVFYICRIRYGVFLRCAVHIFSAILWKLLEILHTKNNKT